MKTIDLDQTTLDDCVANAQQEQVVLTRGGRPVAVVFGVEGLDDEQLQLGRSDEFSKLIEQRRAQKSLGRAELEHKLAASD